MALPALRPLPQPSDIWVEFNAVDDNGRTTVPVDCAEPGVTLAVGVELVAGDLEGNRVPATVTGLVWTRGGGTVDLKLHMESFVPAPTTKGKP